MELKRHIIKQAILIVGGAASAINAGNKLSNAERLCGVFIDSAIEEVFLSVQWRSSVELIPKTAGSLQSFKAVAVNDCIKVITMNPSNIEWYVDKGVIYFKGNELESGFYHCSKLLKSIKANDDVDMPSIFLTLCSLYLASNIAHSLYSDSIFTEGIQKQYMQKIEEAKKLHYFDYHLVNSARFT